MSEGRVYHRVTIPKMQADKTTVLQALPQAGVPEVLGKVVVVGVPGKVVVVQLVRESM